MKNIIRLRNLNSFFIIASLFLFVGKVNAQQDSQYTNYMYNTMSINPGYAGTRDILSIFGLHRSQWIGLDGAPVTNNFSLHTPIANSNIGIGLSFIGDKIGPSDENSISVDMAYRVQVTENATLSLGIKGTANLLNVDFTRLNTFNPTDPQLENNIDNRFSPNIGAGAYLYTDKYYVGLSVPNFLETSYFDDNSASLAKERMHYYLMGGYVFELSPIIKFKPAFLSKVVNGAPLQLDLSANFLFYEKFILGGAYRLDAAASFMTGFQLSKKLLIGYSYDLETTRLANYNSGSHEIFIQFELFKISDKVNCPRFF